MVYPLRPSEKPTNVTDMLKTIYDLEYQLPIYQQFQQSIRDQLQRSVATKYCQNHTLINDYTRVVASKRLPSGGAYLRDLGLAKMASKKCSSIGKPLVSVCPN